MTVHSLIRLRRERLDISTELAERQLTARVLSVRAQWAPGSRPGMGAVLHLAAFFRSPDEAQVRATNDEGTLALAQAAIQAGVQRFIFTSTSLVYSTKPGHLAQEDDTVQPTQAYPASKVAAERALLALNQNANLGLRILRLAFVYGEGDPHLEEGLAWFRN